MFLATRSPSVPQSVFRHPLSEILFAEAAVRVLRELFRAGRPLSSRIVADRAATTIQTVRRTLDRLAALGVVEAIGQGRYPSYRPDPAHPLAPALQALFDAEAARAEIVFAAIRDTALGLSPAPEAVWVYGSVARGDDVAGSDLDVAVVAPEPVLQAGVDRLRQALSGVESTQAVSISVVGVSTEDVVRLSAGDPWWIGVERDAVPLVGPDPASYARRLRRTS